MSIYDVDMSEEQILREECQGESWKKEEIGVGEYVRTKDGKIGIFDRYSSRKENSLYKSPFDCFIKIKNRKTPLQCCEDYIVKHSKQLINVLGKGDIIITKDEKVYKFYDIKEGKIYCEDPLTSDILIRINIDEVSMILAKEQLEANCYKVGGLYGRNQ